MAKLSVSFLSARRNLAVTPFAQLPLCMQFWFINCVTSFLHEVSLQFRVRLKPVLRVILFSTISCLLCFSIRTFHHHSYSVDCRSMFTAGSLIRWPTYHQSRHSALIALLLLMGNVEPNPDPQTINFGLLNARSSVNEAALIHDVVNDHRLDIVAVTETWMLSDNPAAIKQDITPVGYHVLHACRGSSANLHRGGGVAIIHRDSFNVSTVDLGCFTEFEYLSVKLRSPTAPSQITCIYRPPGSVSNAFCDDLSNMFDQLLLSGQQQIVCGDFNSPGDDGKLSVVDCRSCCHSYNQQQLVTHSTHQAGNILDLIIVPEQSIDFVRDVTVQLVVTQWPLSSSLSARSSPPCPQTVSHTSRDIKRIDLQSFRRGIYTPRLYDADVMESLSTDAYTELFESEVTWVLDVCAPLRTKTRRQGSHNRVPLSKRRASPSERAVVGETFPSIRFTVWQTAVPRGKISRPRSNLQVTCWRAKSKGHRVSWRFKEDVEYCTATTT